MCWMAWRWYGYGLNFIYPPPHKLIHPFRGVNHLGMEAQRPEFLMPFQLKRPGLLPRRFEFDEDNFSARQEYQPVRRTCPSGGDEFQSPTPSPRHFPP